MYQVRFTYRTVAGRVLPVTLTESGYSLGQPVSRTTTAHYDDKGLLTHIDGPLPGPASRCPMAVACSKPKRLKHFHQLLCLHHQFELNFLHLLQPIQLNHLYHLKLYL